MVRLWDTTSTRMVYQMFIYRPSQNTQKMEIAELMLHADQYIPPVMVRVVINSMICVNHNGIFVIPNGILK
jgi:hypothetical protein